MKSSSINTILVPIDLSEASYNALGTAVGIAKQNGSGLLLLNIEEPKYTRSEDHDSSFITENTNEGIVQKLIEEIKTTHGIAADMIWRKGNVTDCIIATAYLAKADLIVMGAHGQSGYREGFIGSNTYNVCKYSTVPVMITPTRKKIETFHNVLFPICPTDENAFRYDIILQLLAKDSTLEVVGICDQNTIGEAQGLDRIATEIKDRYDGSITINTSWSMGNTLSGDVFRTAQLKNADLIVISPALDSSIRKGFVSPNTQKIISASQVPVLSIKTEAVPEQVYI